MKNSQCDTRYFDIFCLHIDIILLITATTSMARIFSIDHYHITQLCNHTSDILFHLILLSSIIINHHKKTTLDFSMDSIEQVTVKSLLSLLVAFFIDSSHYSAFVGSVVHYNNLMTVLCAYGTPQTLSISPRWARFCRMQQ